jgi:bifunctional non-homologous end joining protein LigD
MADRKIKARFIEPMLLLRTDKLPEGDAWVYEIKFDGYRTLAFKTGGKVYLRSRNNNDFALRYASITKALAKLPDETVIDGEVLAFDESGKPSFNALQNNSSSSPLQYVVFDLLVLKGRDLKKESLVVRRDLLEKHVLAKLAEPIRYSPQLNASLTDLIHSVKEQGFEGLVAKRRDSVYEPGERSGAWLKMRVNRGQEFVIAGYTVGGTTFDALIFGYYTDEGLIYAARTRNGFTPKVRADLMKRFKGLNTEKCPFINLPEKKAGRWGAGLTAKKMVDCRWLKPELVGQFEFLEWTGESHLRHSRFIALRDDKIAKDVRREA